MNPLLDLGGRTALVTGAGNGIGAAVARLLHREGARVVLVGRTAEKLSAVAAGLGGERCRVAVCDVSDPEQVGALGAELADEEISILVNNAGVAGPTLPLTDIDPDSWDAVFASNVRSIYLVCREFVPAMVRAGAGQVVNIGSVAGKRPLVNRTPYVATKAAVLGLTAALACEVGPLGVIVNCVSPGPVDGERMQTNFERTAELTGVTVDEARADYVSRSALKRMVTEDEVALAVCATLAMPGLCGADIDLSAGMIARS